MCGGGEGGVCLCSVHVCCAFGGGEELATAVCLSRVCERNNNCRTNLRTEAEPQQIVAQGYSHAYSTSFHN